MSEPPTTGAPGAALKRLNLTRVRDVGITDCPTVTVDDPLQQIFTVLRSSRSNEILLLDRRGRPYKWLRRGDLMRAKGSPARAGTPVHDAVARDAALRDALEAVLTDSSDEWWSPEGAARTRASSMWRR